MALGFRRRKAKTAGQVPGPSPNPATNLLIIDIATRGTALIAARAIEKAALRMRYRDAKAEDIVEGRSVVSTLAATSAARMATRSVPGLLLVAGGLLAKTLFDRSLRPRVARRRGDRQLAKQAAKADE
jgi:hypothetical protein